LASLPRTLRHKRRLLWHRPRLEAEADQKLAQAQEAFTQAAATLETAKEQAKEIIAAAKAQVAKIEQAAHATYAEAQRKEAAAEAERQGQEDARARYNGLVSKQLETHSLLGDAIEKAKASLSGAYSVDPSIVHTAVEHIRQHVPKH
jgi:flagellar biosynthesis/type III secretory pathway protein FliH